MNKRIKRILLGLGFTLLFYPMLELVLPLNMSGRITRGNLTNSIDTLSLESLADGSFQENVSDYVNDQIGFFTFFVKLHNQLEYSLFDNIFTGDVVAGKENYLYEQAYIDSYFGEDFIGIPKIERFTAVLKELQDSMKARGKVIVYGMATGKASFYPEYLPYQKKIDTTNYEYFTRFFKEKGVNHIDYRPYFMDLKKEYGNLLFPKYGIHWSTFSNFFVTDTLIKYIESKTGWDLPNIHLDKINYSKEPLYYDNDIAGSMNLFFTPKPDSMAYPEFSWDKDAKDKGKKLLIIGDSYSWELVERMRLGTDCFDEIEFWYYNVTVHTDKTKNNFDHSLPVLTTHRNLAKTIAKFDAVLLLTNEPGTAYRGWRFPKWALNAIQDSTFQPGFRADPYLRQKLKENAGWRKGLQELAKQRGLTYEEMLEEYLHNREFKF